MKPYIHQKKNWPQFIWSNETLINDLALVRNLQGRLVGKMQSLGFRLRGEASLETITLDVLKSSEIEGELLDLHQVRSSVARGLGMDISGLIASDRNVDGVVNMTLDATQNFHKPLSSKRLFNWHSSLFPTGKSGTHNIVTGNWRNDKDGPMMVISGAMGKEKIHFQAPDSEIIKQEMKTFIKWFNDEEILDEVLKAGIAHLWFVTIHPFDDGNGRIARALTDLLLARSDGSPQRFYSMSAQIRLERKGYYDILEKTQKGNLDITLWLKWFLNCLMNALKASDKMLAKVMFKFEFWRQHAAKSLNNRQVLLLNKVLDGFEGKLTSGKWSKIGKCSADTALRDIQDLINKNVLKKEIAGGRSTNYELSELEG